EIGKLKDRAMAVDLARAVIYQNGMAGNKGALDGVVRQVIRQNAAAQTMVASVVALLTWKTIKIGLKEMSLVALKDMGLFQEDPLFRVVSDGIVGPEKFGFSGPAQPAFEDEVQRRFDAWARKNKKLAKGIKLEDIMKVVALDKPVGLGERG